MTIQEQIQIVEDNLNEYGQTNITIEEYIYIKDELYSSGCLAGIESGRAEVIEEILNKVNSYISDMKKYFSETQDKAFLCAISEAQRIRNIIRDMLKENK